MTLPDLKTLVEKLPHGKRLPTAVYVFRGADTDFGPKLNQLLAILATQHEIDGKFNVIKFRTDELKVSFLHYPNFREDAHPALRHAVTIDLVTGKARHTDYADNHNPPILHRKETFLAEHHPERSRFESLTCAGEAAGLGMTSLPVKSTTPLTRRRPAISELLGIEAGRNYNVGMPL